MDPGPLSTQVRVITTFKPPPRAGLESRAGDLRHVEAPGGGRPGAAQRKTSRLERQLLMPSSTSLARRVGRLGRARQARSLTENTAAAKLRAERLW
jgi:hypothetical protein